MTCQVPHEKPEAFEAWLVASARAEELILALKAIPDAVMPKFAAAIEPIADTLAGGVVLFLDHREGKCSCGKPATPAEPADAMLQKILARSVKPKPKGGHGYSFQA